MTLFPKCFSSFDHSTCALSVSGRYLALEDIYLPFRAAFPNYSTRRRSFTEARRPARRGSHPLWRPVPGNSEGTSPEASSTNYNSGPGGPDFKFELLPLHSPLLGQSLLVSFPPLIDMLKFSGYSYLIRGQHFRKLGVLRTWTRRAPGASCANYCAGEAAARPPLYFGDGHRQGRADPQRRPPGGVRGLK